ncbi:hypothetical protein QN239_31605 [Mycolicibacterium sp. Y3]
MGQPFEDGTPSSPEPTVAQAIMVLANVIVEVGGKLGEAIYSHKQSVEGVREELERIRKPGSS